MKFEQDTPEFTPVVITLETREEADYFWAFLEEAVKQTTNMGSAREQAVFLCNLFSLNYRG